MRKSKPTIDRIDRGPAHHCGLADEELGFIPLTMLRAGINYDIKYRTGGEAEGGEG